MNQINKGKKVYKRSGQLKNISKVRVTYSGSPDSEVVAGYMEKFDYRPAKRSQIRQKYADLIRSVSL